MPHGGTVRSSWSEEVRIGRNKIYVSTAVERTVVTGESLDLVVEDVKYAIAYAHTSNIEAAIKNIEEI